VNIFLSFASEQKDDAELIAVSLRDRGHTVFFSRDTLPAAESFDLRIEKAIAAADLVIFLLSPQSIARGKYTLTELGFVKQKWKNPSGHVLPVMVADTPIETIPSYLRAVGILEPEGNIAAETASHADKLLVKGGRRRLALFAVAGVVSGGLSYFAWFIPYLQITILQTGDVAPATIAPGIVFGILVAGCNWMSGLREKVLLVALIVFTTVAWVLAYDSTYSIYNQLTGYQKEVSNAAAPAKPQSTDAAAEPKSKDATPAELQKEIEYVPFRGAISGFVGGLVGGIATVCGIAVANRRFRRMQDLLPVIVAATVLGGLVEVTMLPGASSWTLLMLFVAWQTAVIVLIANGLTSNATESA
jgi:TIR domain